MMERKKYKVNVGILTYNDPAYLTRFLLESIRYYTEYSEEFAITIVDDGSPIDALESMRHLHWQTRDWHSDTFMFEHRENRGIVAGWNTITRSVDADYVILLNNDVIVTRYWLTALMYFLENNHVGTVNPLIYFINENMAPAAVKNSNDQLIETVHPITREKLKNLPHGYMETRPELPGRCMAANGSIFGFSKKLYDEIGGFDKGLRSFYEEIDFGTECAKRGYPSYSLPFPHCYHLWSQTFAKNPSLRAQETLDASRVHYVGKWGGDIGVEDETNPHNRFMAKIKPRKLQWMAWDPKKKGPVIQEYQETEDDVIESLCLPEKEKTRLKNG